MKEIDVENWNRKEHYEFFSKMQSPYFGITTEVDCTKTYQLAKEKGESFFAHYYHKSMVAANNVENFRYRIYEGKVVVFDEIHAGTTIAREDGTFGFSYVEFSHDFDVFNQRLKAEILAVQNSTGLRLNNDDIMINLIRHSTLPWNHFSSVINPTNFSSGDTVPKIVFGGISDRDGKKMLPVAIEAHHGLMDGFHLSLYLKEFQKLLNLE